MARRKPSTKRWQGRGGCLAEAVAIPVGLLLALTEWPPVPFLIRWQRSVFYGHSFFLLTCILAVAFATAIVFVAWHVARHVVLVVERARAVDDDDATVSERG